MPAGGARPTLALLGRILRHVRPHRRQAVLAVGGMILQALLQLVPVVVFRALVNELTGRHPAFGGVAVLLAVGFGAVLATGLLSVGTSYLAAEVAGAVACDLRTSMYGHLLDQSLGYFTRLRSGEILSHLVNDVNGVETVLSESALDVVRELCLGTALVLLMFVFDWRLALLTLLVTPLLLLPFRLAGTLSYHTKMAVQEQLASLTVQAQETLSPSGVALIKAFSRGSTERRRFALLAGDLRRRQVRAAAANRWLEMGAVMLQAAGPTALLLLGGLFITHGSARLGTVLSFSTIIVAQLAVSAGRLSRGTLATVGSLSLWQRVFGVLDDPIEIVERPAAVRLGEAQGSVRFEGVTFTYPGAAEPALRDVDVSIEPGQFVSLVGPSGAGKSTFISLLARFVDPQQGAIRLDGTDIRDVTFDSLHDTIGMVFQDTFLFHDTLRENLRYGRPEASEEEIARAAADANLDPVIATLPDGLDTVVGERGFRLSGGEKQRVAIARVLLKDPRILLLDEATAHLDNVSEALIQAALRRLFAGRTCIVIAHRLSTVIASDLLLVLDRGRVVERGRHEELLGAGGLYTRLHAGGTPAGVAVPSRGDGVGITRP